MTKIGAGAYVANRLTIALLLSTAYIPASLAERLQTADVDIQATTGTPGLKLNPLAIQVGKFVIKGTTRNPNTAEMIGSRGPVGSTGKRGATGPVGAIRPIEPQGIQGIQDRQGPQGVEI